MDKLYARKACCRKLLRGLFLIFLLIFMPFRLWSQTTGLCSIEQSWIARWTIPTITDLGTTRNVVDQVGDGSRATYYQPPSGSPWTFDIDFGIVRDFTGLEIYSPSVNFSPHSYEIFVREDNTAPYISIKPGVLKPFSNLDQKQLIDFGGNYYKAKNVRIVFSDAYAANGNFASTNPLRIYEMNFFQCGVDPLVATPIPTAIVPTPALSCAEGKDCSINGIINSYYPGLSDAAKGSKTVMVDTTKAQRTARHLVAGDRVLIIQMQNTLISETNSMAYGDSVDFDLIASGWTDVRNTGEYEFGIVESIVGKTIQLTQPLQKNYDAKGVFQMVYSPVYKDVTLTGTINAEKWNGYCGGIVTFDAQTLNLNKQKIDVSSQGFRGGKMNSNGDPPVQWFYDVYCTDNKLLFGEKGEGIAGAPTGTYLLLGAKRFYSNANLQETWGGSNGRGAPGNAGGGGNDHNSGGGGGGNIGSGGQGGAAWGNTLLGMTAYFNNVLEDGHTKTGNDSGFVPNGGMGGTGCKSPDPFRIWMGGAGGGGHQNNNAATGGGRGGGIILVTAREVVGTGSLLANGEDALNTTNLSGASADGAGGGGAGGTIVFGFNHLSDPNLLYSAIGGVGGSVSHSGEAHGPGGGGGGGAIILSVDPPNVTNYNVDGGKNGVYYTSTGTTPWGANSGQKGVQNTSDKLSALYTYPCDHGDAPVSFGDAAHQYKLNTPYLGSYVDTEPMALNQPPHETDALGDDKNGIPNDEDGVEPFNPILTTAQFSYQVTVLVNNPLLLNIFVCGWIDFNGNGIFDDSEKSQRTGPLNGPIVLTWNSFPDITGGDSYARFRISTSNKALEPDGIALDGEVEDYAIHISGIPQAEPDFTCTHQDLPVNIYVVANDHIQSDKRGKITLQTPPVNGVAVPNDNNTPDDKTDDYFTYTPLPGFQGTDTFTYLLWNAIGNNAVAKVTVTVKEPISVDFIANPNKGCTPLTVRFTNQSSDKTASFTWDFGDTSPLNHDINSDHTFTTTNGTTINTVRLTMNTGCGIIKTYKLITIHPLPVAVMTEKSNEEKPEVAEFEDVTIGSIRRIWEEDGIQLADTGKILTRTYEHAVTHTIKLTAFNEFDCPNEKVLVHNTVFRDLYVPNAFMPNSMSTDVKTFKPVGYGLTEYSLMIFDLWGNFIWSTTNIKDKEPQDGWDGTKNGKPLPNDVYIWRIHAVFETGKVWKGMLKYSNGTLIPGTYRTQGTVTIIR